MAGSEGSGRKWLACGCFGCLAIVVAFLLLIASFFGTAWVGVRNEQVAERTLEPRIGVGEAAHPEAEAKPGRVVLRTTSGEFHIKPARRGESLRVDARYDQNTYELREHFEPGGDSWTYELEFERKSSMLTSLLRVMLGGAGSSVEVYLPVDVPLELDLHVRQGGGEIDLGGLWLTSAEIDCSQAGFELDISKPLREPMESLVFHGSMGGFSANGIGDASPRRLEVDWSMGGMELDLRGEWRVDSDISIQTRRGGASVQLPRDVNIVGLETRRVGLRGDEETPRPTLTFSVSATQGDLEIIE
jgi:hypothetical protein